MDPNVQPEKEIIKPIAVTKAKEVSQLKPHLGQGRTGLRCKIKTQISKPIVQVMERPPSRIVVPNTFNIQDIAIPKQHYAIPTVKPKGDTNTKVIYRKTIWDVRKFPFILIKFIDPLPKQ